jgi:hypothetical protein
MHSSWAKEALRAHNAPYARLCMRKSMNSYEQQIYVSCRPLTHFWMNYQLDLTLKYEPNPNGGLVKDLMVP